MASTLTEDLYEKLTNEEDGRACRDISERACVETPGNFLLILVTYFLTKLADAIANPKTVLAWLITSVGAPAWVLGLLVPIRESGSLIPQLLIGGVIRRLQRRKWAWVVGSLLQGLSVIGIGVVAFSLSGAPAGFWILALLVLFSLARGLCSVASKDVVGKTIPKGQRGQLTGWSASAAGIAALLLGLLLLTVTRSELTPALLGGAVAAAGGLWLLAALVYALVREQPGETEGGASALRVALRSLRLLHDDAAFRRFVLARALLMCSALSAPYYVALAQQYLGSPGYLLGLFVVAGGCASLVSAPVWGRCADRSSRQVMAAAGALAAAVGFVLAGCHVFADGLLNLPWLVPAAFFLLSVAHSGVRVGRKTYVVDLASGNRRTDYVSVGNTVIGVLLLLVGGIGVLTAWIGNAGVIALLALMGLGGAVLSAALQETG